jgi:hypothetical protein
MEAPDKRNSSVPIWMEKTFSRGREGGVEALMVIVGVRQTKIRW